MLNTQVCDNLNFFLMNYSNDPFGHLKWLHEELKDSEKNFEDVIIAGHIPPGDFFCSSAWAQRYNILVERYSDIIKG